MIKNIVVDPGHGGLDKNGRYTTAPNKMTVFPDGEVAYEGVLNREIAKKVIEEINSILDVHVEYTVDLREEVDLPLRKRVAIANRFNKFETLFISIHCNAFNGEATGFEIFTSPGETKSDKLAEAIADAVEPIYQAENVRLRYDLTDGDKDKEAKFTVLTKTICPAVLIECGFFDNREEFELLSDEEFQSKLAKKISEGIKKFIDEIN